MEDLTNHQLLLMEVRDKFCGGNAAELARRLQKDATYINRLFYPAGKPGRKGIGLEIMDAANRAFFLPAGFWDTQSPALDARTVDLLKARQLMRPLPEELAIERARGVPAFLPLRLGETSPNWGSWGSSEVVDGNRRVHSERPSNFGMETIYAWDHPDDLPPGEFVMVPRLDVHLSAGGGRDQVEIELTKDNPQAFRAEWIRLMKLKPAKLAAMRASGDSMEPTIHDGDSLLIDTSQTEPQDGKVYALWYEGGERVKRLYRLPGGGLRIKSDNAAYGVIELGADYSGHVRIIGRVVHRSGTGGL